MSRKYGKEHEAYMGCADDISKCCKAPYRMETDGDADWFECESCGESCALLCVEQVGPHHKDCRDIKKCFMTAMECRESVIPPLTESALEPATFLQGKRVFETPCLPNCPDGKPESHFHISMPGFAMGKGFPKGWVKSSGAVEESP